MNHINKALNTAKAPTPFKVVKDMVVKGGGGVAKDVGRGIGRGIGKALRKLAEPTIRHNKAKREEMAEWQRKADAGELNY